MKKWIATCVAAVLATFALCAATVDADYRIVVPDREETSVWRALKEAAETVQKAVQESTGLTLKIVEASATTGKGFYFGDAFARRDGLSVDGLAAWGNAWRVKDGSVYFYGARDYASRTDTKTPGWRHCVLPSILAAIRFMENEMDIRFVMPGWVGTDVPARGALELKEGAGSAVTPKVDYGVGGGFSNMVSAMANGDLGYGVHRDFVYFDVFKFEKYAKTHPEYFGVVKGKRYCEHAWAENNFTPICITNPEVEELLVAAICKRFDEGADVCELCQSDGTWYCECENCLDYAGLKDDPGDRHSEQIWRFFRHIAERIEKERPGKIMKLMSYAAISRPPRDFHAFPSNVMIEICDYSDENLKRWKEWGAVPHGFTIYTYLWGEYYREGFTAKHSLAFVSNAARKFAAMDCRGLWRCGGGELWGTEGPQYYVFNRTMLNPKATVGELFTEYLTRMYGPAAKPMRVFFETLDRKLALRDAENEKVMDMNGKGEMFAKTKKSNVESIAAAWDEATVSKMEKALAAAQATEGLTDKQSRRLKLVAFEFGYSKTIAAVCRSYLAFRAAPSEATVKATVEAVRRYRKLLERIYAEKKKHWQGVPGWTDIPVFGGWCKADIMDYNGRGGGKIAEPLTWDLEKIQSDYDISGWQKKARETPNLVRLTKWRHSSGHSAEKFEVGKDGAFHFVADGNKKAVRIESHYKDALAVKPGVKYRLSWYVKFKDVHPIPTSRWGGEENVRVWYGAKWAECEQVPLVTYKNLSATDWVHRSVEFTPTGDPKQMTDVVFLVSERSGEYWIRDVTVEELKEK